jgi:hypothetical protein
MIQGIEGNAILITAAVRASAQRPPGTPSSRTLVVSLNSTDGRGRTPRPIAIATIGSIQVQPVNRITTAAPMMTPIEPIMSAQTSR